MKRIIELTVFVIIVLSSFSLNLLEKKNYKISSPVQNDEKTISGLVSVTSVLKNVPTGNIDNRILTIGKDLVESKGIISSFDCGNIFVIRGEFDNWTSFNGKWFELSSDDVRLKEEKGKLLLDTKTLVNRALKVSLKPLWIASVKIVVFDKNGNFVAEQRENSLLNSFIRENYPLSQVEVIIDGNVKSTNKKGEFSLDVKDLKDNQIVKFSKKGYFYKEVSIKELKENRKIIMNKLTGTLLGDIRYEKLKAPVSLGTTRNLTVYLPPNYEKNTDKRYPVIYINDGKSAFDSFNYIGEEMGIDETLEKMYAEKKTEGVIAVAIDESINRDNEYVPWDWENGRSKGAGKEYLDFVKRDVKNYIDTKYRTKTDAKNTIITGCSLGGLISLYAIVSYGDTFGKIIAFSPSLDINDYLLETELKQGKIIKNSKVYYDASKFELRGRADSFKKIEESLKSIGYSSTNIKSNIFAAGTHSPNTWRVRFPLALEWILNDKGEIK